MGKLVNVFYMNYISIKLFLKRSNDVEFATNPVGTRISTGN